MRFGAHLPPTAPTGAPVFEEVDMSIEVPDACTLPTAQQPVRLAEFDELFATVRQVDQMDPTHARLHLTGPAGLTARVRELTVRETECCSFFTFTTTPQPATTGEALLLDIEVPAAYAGVLASLARRATAVSGPGSTGGSPA
jgi:hypothetical protein